MLDEGKITQTEYDIVKTELLEAPAEEWEPTDSSSDGGVDVEAGKPPAPGWRATLEQIPTIYRLAAAGAVLVLVMGVFLGGRSDAAGSVTADLASVISAAPGPVSGSLGFVLDDLVAGWNAVDDPPMIDGGVMTAPEPGELDSFLHRFDGSTLVAGAYDPSDGSVYALMAQSSLHTESVSNLYVHLCYLLHPGSQECLTSFIEQTGMFGRAHADLAGTEHAVVWEFEGHRWQLEIANDVETIRVRGEQGP
jgi:hypothetical protein